MPTYKHANEVLTQHACTLAQLFEDEPQLLDWVDDPDFELLAEHEYSAELLQDVAMAYGYLKSHCDMTYRTVRQLLTSMREPDPTEWQYPSDDEIRRMAADAYAMDDNIDIVEVNPDDPGLPLTHVAVDHVDHGAWVPAWIFVSFETSPPAQEVADGQVSSASGLPTVCTVDS